MVLSLGRRRSVTIEGKTFPSLMQVCKYYGLNYQTVSSRLRTGEQLDKTVAVLLERSKLQYKTKTGIIFNSVGEAAKYFGVNAGTLRNHISSFSTVEDAVYAMKKSRYVRFEEFIQDIVREGFGYILVGQKVGSIEDVCKLVGVARSQYRGRKYIGWSTVEALELVPRRGKNSGKDSTKKVPQ